MEWVIEKALNQLEQRGLVKQTELEIYQFGLECALLKLVHVISYLIIGICTKEVLSLFISACVLIPLRRKSGGYHAKTRKGCYIFSCCTVFLLCLMNKTKIPVIFGAIGMLITNVLILCFAPVENDNRKLSADEKVTFHRQAAVLLVIVNSVIIISFISGKYLTIAYWFRNGLIFVGVLLLIGICKSKHRI